MMSVEEQKEEALKLLLSWYEDNRRCGINVDYCKDCGFGDWCVYAVDIIKGVKTYE